MKSHSLEFTQRSSQPLIVQASSVLSDQELLDTCKKLQDRHWLAQQGVNVLMDETGISFELREDVIPALTDLRERIRNELRFRGAQAISIRIRRYAPGNTHRPHMDCYEQNGKLLLATAILYLTDVTHGGETRFVEVPGLSLQPKANSLVTWINYLDDCSPDSLTMHESAAIETGEKLVAIYLFYGDKSEVPLIRRSLLEMSQQEST